MLASNMLEASRYYLAKASEEGDEFNGCLVYFSRNGDRTIAGVFVFYPMLAYRDTMRLTDEVAKAYSISDGMIINTIPVADTLIDLAIKNRTIH